MGCLWVGRPGAGHEGCQCSPSHSSLCPLLGRGSNLAPTNSPFLCSGSFACGRYAEAALKPPHSSVVHCQSTCQEQPAPLDLTPTSLWVTGLAVCLHAAGSTLQLW